MNYNVNTEEGLKNSIDWTNSMLNMLNDGGVWAVPRSGMQVHMVSRDTRLVRIEEGHTPDPSIHLVLKEAGWQIL